VPIDANARRERRAVIDAPSSTWPPIKQFTNLAEGIHATRAASVVSAGGPFRVAPAAW
jgi:hypothetical protein